MVEYIVDIDVTWLRFPADATQLSAQGKTQFFTSITFRFLAVQFSVMNSTPKTPPDAHLFLSWFPKLCFYAATPTRDYRHKIVRPFLI